MKIKYKNYSINKLRQNDGFTLMELIIVLMILGVLVLLGVPRMAGYTQRAELRRIQHDVKVMEGKMDEAFNTEPGISEEWDENIKDLNLLVLANNLFEREGVAKNIAKIHSSAKDKDASPEKMQVFNMLSNGGGLVHPSDYKVVPEEFKREIGTQLGGTFYVNKEGKVYYEHDKPLTANDKEEVECLAPTPESLDYEFDHKTGTIVKYHGDLQHLVIPAQFKVDEVCYPVIIIGRGAFAQGNFESVIVPEGVEKIEEDAFKDNKLEKVELPSTITEIGDNAFSGNGFTEEDDVIIRNDEGSVDLTDTGLEGSAEFVGKDVIINTDGSSGGSGSGGSGGSSGGSGSGGSSGGGTGSSGSQTPSSNPGGNGSTSGKQNGNIVSNGTITIDKDKGVIKDYSGSDKNVTIPDKIVVDGEDVVIKEVEEGAYQGKGLITVEMPTGLKRIEDYAFAGNQLIAAWIPDTVEHIGTYAFAYNGITDGINYKPSIKSISVKGQEYIEKIDDEGDVVGGIPEINLLDHVFVNHTHKHKIDITYDSERIKIEDVSIAQDTQVVEIGGQAKIKLNLTPVDADTDTLLWESNDETIATVDKNGIVSGIKVGSTTIKMYTSNNQFTDTIKVNVIPPFEQEGFQADKKFITPKSGIYKIETWGAAGGSVAHYINGRLGGNGGYASAEFYFDEGTELNVFVGDKGTNGGGRTEFVGSGNRGTGGFGGGASDVRVNGTSLDDRIIVAGGGGGGKSINLSEYGYKGGYGGGANQSGGSGTKENTHYAKIGEGGTLSRGGSGQTSGRKGHGGRGVSFGSFSGGGGGGGYYGGGGGRQTAGGGGGSGYVNTSLAIEGSIQGRSGANSVNGKVVITFVEN